MSYLLTDAQISRLKTLVQDAELWVGITREKFSPEVKSYRGQIDQQYELMPIVNIGSGRVGFTTETVSFSASWEPDPRGTYNNTPTFSWTAYNSTNASVATGSGSTFSFIPADVGEYLVTCAASFNAGALVRTVKRSLIVFDRTSTVRAGFGDYAATGGSQSLTEFELVGISGLGGSMGRGGWSAQFQVIGNSTKIQENKAVIIYIEDYWNEEKETVGSNILFQGYIVGRSIQYDPDKDMTTFTAVTPEHFLQRSVIRATDFWDVRPSNGFGLYNVTSGPAANPLTVTQAINHIVLFLSNYWERHDVVLFPTSNTLATITANEGAVWSILTDFAENDFLHIFCDRHGSIRLHPDYDVHGHRALAEHTALAPDGSSSTRGWKYGHAKPALSIDSDLAHFVGVEEQRIRTSIAQVNGVNALNNDVVVATYPAGVNNPPPPSTDTFGDPWDIRSGLVVDSQATVDFYAKRLYGIRNDGYGSRIGPYTATVQLGLNHAIELDHIVTLSEAFVQGASSNDHCFVVTDVAHDYDLREMTFKTTIRLEEFVGMRWTNGQDVWSESFDDSTFRSG